MAFNKALIVGSLIVSLLFLCASSFLLYVGNTQSVSVDSTYISLFDNYNETLLLYGTSQEIVDSGQLNPAGFDQGLFKNVIVANKQLSQSTTLMIKFISNIPLIILIPAGVLSIIITLIFVLALFGFIKTLSKQEP